jgi:hypothetical protein
MRDMKYFCWFLGIIFLLTTCKSTDKIFSRASELAGQGKYCEAVNELKDIKVNRKTENQQIEALLASVNDYGQQCVKQYMNQARQLRLNARTRQDFERAYAECMTAKQFSEQIINNFQPKLNNQAASFRIWQSGDEAYLLDLYEAITEVMYQEALESYHKGQLESAYEQFKLVESRQSNYKESIQNIQIIQETLAENYYQKGKQLFLETTNYQAAYDNFKNAVHWLENYKDADSLKNICYDKVTDQFFETAQQNKQSYKFRGAYQYFKMVFDRGGVQRYPDLREELADCIRLGRIKIFIESSDDDFNHRLQLDIQSQIQDDFLCLVNSYTEADCRVLPDFRYQTSHQNIQRNRRTAYLIRSYEVEQRQDSQSVIKVRKYFAEDEVYYYEVINGKETICTVTYSFRGKGNLIPNHQSQTFKGRANDQIAYNELQDNYNLYDLTLNMSRHNPTNNSSTKPLTDAAWLERFQSPRTLKTNHQLEQEAKNQLQNDLIKAIIGDLQEMLKKIE